MDVLVMFRSTNIVVDTGSNRGGTHCCFDTFHGLEPSTAMIGHLYHLAQLSLNLPPLMSLIMCDKLVPMPNKTLQHLAVRSNFEVA